MDAKKFIRSVVTFVITVFYVLVIKNVDVKKIGPEGTKVGLSTINSAFHNLTGVNMTWYSITEGLGILAILVAAMFGAIGLFQLVKRKSLFRVDKEIIALGVLYVIVIILYIIFELVVINYRPIIMPGASAPEASFPSSHTMLICVVMGSAMMVINKYIFSDSIRIILKIFCVTVMVATVVGRLICGVHWLTDIAGGLLISRTLLSLYSAVID